jgi:hypothetical protein
VLNRAGRRWELRGRDGKRVHGWVTLELAARTDPAVLNRALARRGLPTLAPDLGWWECALIGGPFDGWHEYLDPAACDRPPEVLAFGPDGRAYGGAVPFVRYRRGPQLCGHGRACPYPYHFTGGGGG